MPSSQRWFPHRDAHLAHERLAFAGASKNLLALFLTALFALLSISGTTSGIDGLRAPVRVDLGTAFVHEFVEGTIKIWNPSESAIRVFAVEVSCPECTSINFSHAQNVEAGESLHIKVIIRGNGISRDQLSELHVRTSDPDRPMFDIAIVAHFVSVVSPATPILDCGVIRAGAPVVATFRVRNSSPDPVRIALNPRVNESATVVARCDPVVVEGSADPEVPAEAIVALTLQVRAGVWSLEDVRLSFETDAPDQPSLVVPLRGVVWALPPSVSVAGVLSSQSSRGPVLSSSNHAESFCRAGFSVRSCRCRGSSAADGSIFMSRASGSPAVPALQPSPFEF